ncbi:MAG: hypothetical protein D6765_16885, partial [Bacteroidetes bacterium]
MHLIFGLALDEEKLLRPRPLEGGVWRVGPAGLLHLLESMLGHTGHREDTDHLRIGRMNRAAAALLQDGGPEWFFRRSFEADPLGTAADLLRRRDELLLAGWDFQPKPQAPLRLQQLAALQERYLREAPPPGIAERWTALLNALQEQTPPFERVEVVEPPELLPPHLQRVLKRLGAQPRPAP